MGQTYTASSGSSYKFLSLQPDQVTPVAYDPCRPIRYVVNRRTQPPGGHALLLKAIASVSGFTGLQFLFEGETDESPTESRDPFQRDRYGDRWAPVLISWTDPTEISELRDSVAGIAGSVAISESGWNGRGKPRLVYVTGEVALDGPQLEETLATDGGRNRVGAVIQHELGHLVGLDHVSDESQLMHPSGNPEITSPQSGDISGLARLGRGVCFELL